MYARTIIFLIVFQHFAAILHADALDDWTIRFPDKPLPELVAVTYAAGAFVAVGDHIMVSPDGATWTTAVVPATNYLLNAISYGNGRFVAVGRDGSIFSSSDALEWRTENSRTSAYLAGITWGVGEFVAVGWSVIEGSNGDKLPVLLTSPDGRTWTERDSGTDSPSHAVAFGNEVFVALADDKILSSPNGIDWTVVRSGDTAVAAFFAEGQFLVQAESPDHSFLLSTNGTNWSSYPFEIFDPVRQLPFINCMTGGPHLVAVGANGWIFTSDDGQHWQPRESGTYHPLFGVAYGDGSYVAVGYQGAILRSRDGLEWTHVAGRLFDSTLNLAYGKDGFVAVAYADDRWFNSATILLHSQDGAEWQRVSPHGTTGFILLVYSEGRYLSISQNFGPNGIPPLITKVWTSTNAVDWSPSDLGVNAFFYAGCFGASRFVILGGACSSDDCSTPVPIAITSSDSLTWTKTELPVSANAVAFGNGRFVAVGGRTNLVSLDGSVWQPNQMPGGTGLNYTSIAFGNRRFVAVSPRDLIVASPDGIKWDSVPTTLGTSDGTISFGEGFFLFATEIEMMVSSDGVHWIHRPLPYHPEGFLPPAIAFGANRFLLAQDRYLAQSGNIIPRLSVGSPTSEHFPITLSGGVTGQNISVEQSPDLRAWSPAKIDPAPNMEIPREGNVLRQFYRIRVN